jgi:hypothetical protein
MKQQCHITFIYLSWIIYLGGVVLLIMHGSFVLAIAWFVAVPLVQWAYIHSFPKLSPYMGYGAIADKPATIVEKTNTKVTLYTGLGCPFCPVVNKRLTSLKDRMGFQVEEIDVTLKNGGLLR